MLLRHRPDLYNGCVPRRAAWSLALLVLLAWGPSTWRAGLSFDDAEVLADNPVVEGSLGWSAVLLRDYWDHLPAGPAGQYRPAATASLRLDHALHDRVWGYHLTNVLLHLGVVLAAASLFTVRGRRLPWVGLALLAVHPALADSVAWVSGRTSMVSALGGLLGALATAWAARRGSRPGVALGCALAGLAATLGKEDGVVFALLAVALAAERGRRLVAPALAGAALGGLLYLTLRHAALGAWLPVAHGAPLEGAPLLERMRVAGAAGLEGLRVLVWPAGYPARWDLADLDGAGGWAALPWLLGATALLLGVTRRGCDALAGLALAALAVLPVAQLVPAGELLAPRFLYLPLLFAAPAVHALWREAGRRPLVAAAPLVACLPLAWDRATVYASRASFWEAQEAWRTTPQVLNALGNARLEEGEPERAAAAWREALALDARYSRPWVNLATLEMRAGAWEEAELLLLSALGASERNPLAWAHLGRTRHELGRHDQAAAAFERALELSPRVAGFWRGLGHARRDGGDASGARAAFEQALRLDPADDRARTALGELDG